LAQDFPGEVVQLFKERVHSVNRRTSQPPQMIEGQGDRDVPPRILLLSAPALAIPIWAQYAAPQGDGYELLLWLLALIPVFLLAYYRGWRGVLITVGIGMVVLSVSQAILAAAGSGIRNWGLFYGVFVAYIAIALALGLVTELLHRARREAEELALLDPLTEMPNRRYASQVLFREVSAAKRGRRLCVVILDLDDFKRYNDENGHSAGDRALRKFGRVLMQQTRDMNLSARYGGEEFLSVVAEADLVGAGIFVDRVRQSLADSFQPGEPTFTFSAGIAAYHHGMAGVDDLIDAADGALYVAKSGGRNLTHTFDPDFPVAVSV
jgi:diguanylate cyclase (GGDEF)-like protein